MKILIATLIAIAALVLDNPSSAYTEEELEILGEDCYVSLNLQKQFSGGMVILYSDIQLGT